ncbi:multiubiquitin domain-containing protein [Hydrocarboniphaga effusa]|uniref:multiubiquitin domain-containing protein n=1 Tax=Hydrocarboniphaga effusa TaxID=243629 RepID=UPI003BAB7121
MKTEIEDVLAAHQAHRAIRQHGPYRVKVGDAELNYQDVVIPDPVPTGQQILDAAKLRPTLQYSLYQVLTNGLLEELRPDETTDLRANGVERFLAFRSDRSFRFQLDGRVFDWGFTFISGRTLKKLAGVDIQATDVWLEVRNDADRLIDDKEFFDLSAPEVEKFYTAQRKLTIIVNGRKKNVEKTELSFKEVVLLAFPDAVFDDKTVYTVTYAEGPRENPEGTLVEGRSVKLKNGMVFNVARSDKS